MEIEGLEVRIGASGEARQAASAVDSPRSAPGRPPSKEPFGERAAVAFICPECREPFGVPEKLGAHIERHRPASAPSFTLRGLPASRACVRGCGRHFRKRDENLERLRHEKVCDGSEPLPLKRSSFQVGQRGIA
jgi:hypothetical protein